MQKYDQIVVGGGVSGLTMAALLGLNGKRVLLLEKSRKLGGSMARFSLRGIPFDTGFHFTGGLEEDGILTQMLRVLGIADAIRPVPIQSPQDSRFVFEDSGNSFEQPLNYESLIAGLIEKFPDDREGIQKYFAMVEDVCRNTASFELRAITENAHMTAEDFVTLENLLDELITSPELKTLLAAYVMCYGTPPGEVSFANHSRVVYALYKSIARVEGGGQAFTDALRGLLSKLNVDVRTGTTIYECADIQNKRAKSFVLTTGERVAAGECIFTIHPRGILETMPQEHLHKAFKDRVNAFEPAIGFFSVYAVVPDGPGIEPFSPGIISRFPTTDTAHLFQPTVSGDRAMVIMKHREEIKGEFRNVLTVHEVAIAEDTEAWAESSVGHRPEAYSSYKQERTASIMRRVMAEFPEYAESIEVLASASMLTFRDYLNTPWGSAYGIKQKMGQFNLFGRLPIRNLYASGQSSTLPGLIGAMMSSFIVARSLIGRDAYQRFIDERLSVKDK